MGRGQDNIEAVGRLRVPMWVGPDLLASMNHMLEAGRKAQFSQVEREAVAQSYAVQDTVKYLAEGQLAKNPVEVAANIAAERGSHAR